MEFSIAAIGWTLLVVLLEYITWRIFYRKTVRICFLTEPDLPFSRFFTIGSMRVLAILHASLLVGLIFFFHNLLW
tara:strand:+ start:388 stop:612 length:225 start_codon:yes stop_codon:yes gene_type:complete